MVTWSPLVLAVGYTVELRPVNVGSSSSWLSVDVTSKKLGCSSNRFDFNCSSCVVNSFLILRKSFFSDFFFRGRVLFFIRMSKTNYM